MATILFSAAGAAIGSGFGGSVLGLSGAVIGRAVGATIGRSLDQRILGGGADAGEVGRVDRFRVSGVGYGTPIQEVWGRMRVSGQIIWASRFQERRQQSGGGKGAPRTATSAFSYTVSLAIALCRGKALRVGRIWADGVEIAVDSIDLRFYPGSEDQLPDPKIEAVEGVGHAPTYRGMAYVVIENLEIARFGNRVPQFSFEVIRQANVETSDTPRDLIDAIKAVALIPGTGEYALATTPVHFNAGPGQNTTANVHTVQGQTDFTVSLNQLTEELPNCQSVSLVVSWFGNDLRCNQCEIRPKVEQQTRDGIGMPWSASGLSRASAQLVPASDGRSIYGGTPTDKSVIEAIQAVRASGKEVMFYPFILMDQLAENGLPDPWSDSTHQPALPWRGRITLSEAPGRAGSPDGTLSAASEVASFLGTAAAGNFTQSSTGVTYSGPAGWGYRRFVLHYAHLCAAAGGVDAFCIGSEMRGMTQIQSLENSFPFVSALKTLAADVRGILGPTTKISYAADWSEYFGFSSGDIHIFNLDPLWADPNVDFVGIDYYMPISDWRDGSSHADASWGAIYNPQYLEANIAGGEGYDYYYESPEAEEIQRRTAIVDTQFGEDWIFRFKDLKSWWSNDHHNRIDGVRQPLATEWIPGMKPIRFTEYGCAALDKATNQPNKFQDPKSSESSLPRNSNGRRDDFIQFQYFLVMSKFWSSSVNNPIADLYNGRMVDFDRSHAWAWDSRPFPEFPGNSLVWNDGENYSKGHWLNGRVSNQPLALVASEICAFSTVTENLQFENLSNVVRGFAADESATSRAKIQTLSVIYSFDAVETDGSLRLVERGGRNFIELDESELVASGNGLESTTRSRAPESTLVGRVRLAYIAAESDFEVQTADSIFPQSQTEIFVESEVEVQLTSFEANAVVDRCLAESRLARDAVNLLLPLSELELKSGSHITLGYKTFRVDRTDESDMLKVDALRVDSGAYIQGIERGETPTRSSSVPATPVFSTFLDLPLLRGDEVPHAPHIAVTANPWPGGVSVWSSASTNGFVLNTEIAVPALIGVTLSPLVAHPPSYWDRGSVLRLNLPVGTLSSIPYLDVLNGANAAAIGDGSSDNWEVIQFSEAVLVGMNTYELKGLLRGLAGTDGTVNMTWPVGSLFVMLDGTLPQVELPLSSRGLERFYRIGSTALGLADRNVEERIESFEGIGLRPYSVAHLGYQRQISGDVVLTWIRRTRIDGDSWNSSEVPLGEVSEQYSIEVMKDGSLIRRDSTDLTSWRYTIIDQVSDGVTTPFDIVVAQVSEGFGAGPLRIIEITQVI